MKTQIPATRRSRFHLTSPRSIGDVMPENNISWKSYNDQWDNYLRDKYQLNYGRVLFHLVMIQVSVGSELFLRRDESLRGTARYLSTMTPATYENQEEPMPFPRAVAPTPSARLPNTLRRGSRSRQPIQDKQAGRASRPRLLTSNRARACNLVQWC